MNIESENSNREQGKAQDKALEKSQAQGINQEEQKGTVISSIKALRNVPRSILLRRQGAIVANRYLSEQLKELGLMQIGSFFYTKSIEGGEYKIMTAEEVVYYSDVNVINPKTEMTAAYTSDQLTAALGSCASGLRLEDMDKYSYWVMYKDPYDGNTIQTTSKNHVDALAEMLIHLLETRRKPLEEANKWLLEVR